MEIIDWENCQNGTKIQHSCPYVLPPEERVDFTEKLRNRTNTSRERERQRGGVR
ncbi:hypothetical protein YC2023_045466 [Brassica napus]